MAICSNDHHSAVSKDAGMPLVWLLLGLWLSGICSWYWTGRPRWRSDKRQSAAAYLTPNLQRLFDALMVDEELVRRGIQSNDPAEAAAVADGSHRGGVRSLRMLGSAGSFDRLERDRKPCTFERIIAERVALHSNIGAGYVRFLRGQCSIKLVLGKLFTTFCFICLCAPRRHDCKHADGIDHTNKNSVLDLFESLVGGFGFVKFPALAWNGEAFGRIFATFGRHIGNFILLSLVVCTPASILLSIDTFLFTARRCVQEAHNERLFEQEGLFQLLRSTDTFEKVEDCRVAQELLRTLVALLKRLLRMLRRGTLGDYARAGLGQHGNPVSHLLAKKQLPAALMAASYALARIEVRLRELRTTTRAADYTEGHVYCWWRSKEARLRAVDLRTRVRLALVPSRVRNIEFSHHKVLMRFDGGIFNCDAYDRSSSKKNLSNFLPEGARWCLLTRALGAMCIRCVLETALDLLRAVGRYLGVTSLGKEMQRCFYLTWINVDMPTWGFMRRNYLYWSKKTIEIFLVSLVVYGTILIDAYASSLADKDLASDIILTLFFTVFCDAIIMLCAQGLRAVAELCIMFFLCSGGHMLSEAQTVDEMARYNSMESFPFPKQNTSVDSAAAEKSASTTVNGNRQISRLWPFIKAPRTKKHARAAGYKNREERRLRRSEYEKFEAAMMADLMRQYPGIKRFEYKQRMHDLFRRYQNGEKIEFGDDSIMELPKQPDLNATAEEDLQLSTMKTDHDLYREDEIENEEALYDAGDVNNASRGTTATSTIDKEALKRKTERIKRMRSRQKPQARSDTSKYIGTRSSSDRSELPSTRGGRRRNNMQEEAMGSFLQSTVSREQLLLAPKLSRGVAASSASPTRSPSVFFESPLSSVDRQDKVFERRADRVIRRIAAIKEAQIREKRRRSQSPMKTVRFSPVIETSTSGSPNSTGSISPTLRHELKLPKELEDRSTDSEESEEDEYVAQDRSAIADFFMGEVGLTRRAYSELRDVLEETGATEPEELSTLLDDTQDGIPLIDRISKAMPVAKRRKFGALLLEMHQENALVEYQQRGNATSRQQTQRPEKKTTTSLEKTLTLADDDMNTQGTTLPAKPPKPPSLSEIEEVPLESTEKETPQHLISSKDKAYLGAENASTSALSSRASSPLAVQSSAAPDPSLQPSTSLSSVLDGATNTEGDRPMPPGTQTTLDVCHLIARDAKNTLRLGCNWRVLLMRAPDV